MSRVYEKHMSTNRTQLEKKRPFGGIGGEELVLAMNECVDTHYFYVQSIQVWDMLPSTTTATDTSEESGIPINTNATAGKSMMQNVEYIHLFPFRNYNEWVKSAIKQSYDRAGRHKHMQDAACNGLKRLWTNGKCQHYYQEIDIRQYPRVDLDRFQDGVVRRMKGYFDDTSKSIGGNNNSEEGGGAKHTFLLYLHRDLERTMETISEAYHLPMLPGTGSRLRGKRLKGTCDESVEELYHACFSDELMTFRWDLPENQVWRAKG